MCRLQRGKDVFGNSAQAVRPRKPERSMASIQMAIHSKLTFRNGGIYLNFGEVKRVKFKIPNFYLSLYFNRPIIVDEQRNKSLQVKKDLKHLNSICSIILRC